MTDNQTTDQGEIAKVYVVLGSLGQYDSYIAWVAGVYESKDDATKVAEEQKVLDRFNWALWDVWIHAFHQALEVAGKLWNYRTRDADIVELGLAPEPPMVAHDTVYTVACVPMNTPGKWWTYE